MSIDLYPSESQIRSALLGRVEKFTELTGIKPSAIGKQAVNDPAFVLRIRGGNNFTVDTYRRFMTWLDENWPEQERAAS